MNTFILPNVLCKCNSFLLFPWKNPQFLWAISSDYGAVSCQIEHPPPKILGLAAARGTKWGNAFPSFCTNAAGLQGAGVVSIYHRNMNIPCPPGDDCLRISGLWCNLPRKAAAPAAVGKSCLFCRFTPAGAAAAAERVPLRSVGGTPRAPDCHPAAAPPSKGDAARSPLLRSSQTSA